MLRRRKTAQTTVEFALLIVIVIGAFIGISNYFKRSLQGRWKAAVDDLGEQYDPRAANTHLTHTLLQNQTTFLQVLNSHTGFWTSRTDTTNAIDQTIGYKAVGGY